MMNMALDNHNTSKGGSIYNATLTREETARLLLESLFGTGSDMLLNLQFINMLYSKMFWQK